MMLATIANHQKELWSIATVLLAFSLNRFFRLRPRLNYSVGHSFNLLVEQPLLDNDGNQVAQRQVARTASITVGNSGLQPAKAVEITFNWKPQILNVWPARKFDESVGAFDRYSMKLDSLAPGEQFSIEIMSINAELPLLTAVRSEDCVGRMIKMEAQRVWPTWVLRLIALDMVLGAVAAVYLLVTLVQLIA